MRFSPSLQLAMGKRASSSGLRSGSKKPAPGHGAALPEDMRGIVLKALMELEKTKTNPCEWASRRGTAGVKSWFDSLGFDTSAAASPWPETSSQDLAL